jgi:uncharacterized SAM-binding protein YcdF (DUF218 family)
LKSSCFKCCLLSLIGACVFATMLTAVLLSQVGRWLNNADEPQQADVIVVLGGAFERTLYAADLYAGGYAKRIYLSNPVRENSHRLLDEIGITIPSEHEISTLLLKRKGVPAEAISTLPGAALSTADEGELLKRLYSGRQGTVMVITSPYHVRRARLVINRALENTGVTAVFVATPYERYASDWWHDQDSARQTILELAKIAYYAVGGRFGAPDAGAVAP